jgi:hypothetical protein
MKLIFVLGVLANFEPVKLCLSFIWSRCYINTTMVTKIKYALSSTFNIIYHYQLSFKSASRFGDER